MTATGPKSQVKPPLLPPDLAPDSSSGGLRGGLGGGLGGGLDGGGRGGRGGLKGGVGGAAMHQQRRALDHLLTPAGASEHLLAALAEFDNEKKHCCFFARSQVMPCTSGTVHLHHLSSIAIS
jgi:hypothetical protein